MILFKCLLPFLIVFFIQDTHCKPIENEPTQSHGFWSAIWSWITYPFSWWWGSGNNLIVSTTSPFERLKSFSNNVRIICNERTCTNIKCSKTACVNTTCNIQDTFVTGLCRKYLRPHKPKPSKPIELTPKPTEVDAIVPLQPTTPTAPIAPTEASMEPLQLIERLSAILTKKNAVNKPKELEPLHPTESGPKPFKEIDQIVPLTEASSTIPLKSVEPDTSAEHILKHQQASSATATEKSEDVLAENAPSGSTESIPEPFTGDEIVPLPQAATTTPIALV